MHHMSTLCPTECPKRSVQVCNDCTLWDNAAAEAEQLPPGMEEAMAASAAANDPNHPCALCPDENHMMGHDPCGACTKPEKYEAKMEAEAAAVHADWRQQIIDAILRGRDDSRMVAFLAKQIDNRWPDGGLSAEEAVAFLLELRFTDDRGEFRISRDGIKVYQHPMPVSSDSVRYTTGRPGYDGLD